ncbi:MAG: DsrE family protein [Methyloversatilis sp.]|nr:DsrE family protein [Methyloversatilis sp.]
MKPALEQPPSIDPAAARAPAAGTSAIGVALLLWACDPEEQHRLATPFFHAAAAAAMDTPVEIYFSARSVLLLQPGVAENLRANPFHPKTVLDALREAVDHGAVLLACTDALRAHGMDARNLIPECTRRGGAVQFMGRVCDPGWRTLVF